MNYLFPGVTSESYYFLQKFEDKIEKYFLFCDSSNQTTRICVARINVFLSVAYSLRPSDAYNGSDKALFPDWRQAIS